MPYLTEYVDGDRGVLKTGVGILTGGDIITSAIQESQNPERSRRVRYAIIDLNGVEELRVTGAHIKQVVEINRKTASYTTPGAVRIAAIAPAPLTYGMTRMWQMLADNLSWKIQVFHSRSAALAWLKKELTADDPGLLAEYPTLQRALEEG